MYSREIDGDILTLAPSGWTYGENASTSLFVLIDKETESLWFPAGREGCLLVTEIPGEIGCGLVGIGGFYTERTLEGIQMLSSDTWAEWKIRFPETKFVLP